MERGRVEYLDRGSKDERIGAECGGDLGCRRPLRGIAAWQRHTVLRRPTTISCSAAASHKQQLLREQLLVGGASLALFSMEPDLSWSRLGGHVAVKSELFRRTLGPKLNQRVAMLLFYPEK